MLENKILDISLDKFRQFVNECFSFISRQLTSPYLLPDLFSSNQNVSERLCLFAFRCEAFLLCVRFF